MPLAGQDKVSMVLQRGESWLTQSAYKPSALQTLTECLHANAHMLAAARPPCSPAVPYPIMLSTHDLEEKNQISDAYAKSLTLL